MTNINIETNSSKNWRYLFNYRDRESLEKMEIVSSDVIYKMALEIASTVGTDEEGRVEDLSGIRTMYTTSYDESFDGYTVSVGNVEYTFFTDIAGSKLEKVEILLSLDPENGLNVWVNEAPGSVVKAFLKAFAARLIE